MIFPKKKTTIHEIHEIRRIAFKQKKTKYSANSEQTLETQQSLDPSFNFLRSFLK